MYSDEMRNSSTLNQLQTDVAFLRERLSNAEGTLDAAGRRISNILDTQTSQPAAPSSNLLYNGEIGHSVNSWFDSAYTTDDKAREAAHWFSHDGALSGLALDQTDARTSATNKTLKATAHSAYSANYSRWNSENGWTELTGTKTLDQPLPANFIDATTPLARISLIAARRNKYIEIPESARAFAGIYDNTAGQQKFLTGSLGFAAGLVGDPAASTIERRYRIHVKSDRGFSLLSPEIAILNAPADGFFTATRNISLSWRQTAGQSEVDVYEYLPGTAQYRLVQTISSATSYIHQGAFLRAVSGYPVSSAGSERQAIFYTRTGEMSSLAVNAVNPQWDTINFPANVPNDYNKALTTGRQWLRIGLTVPPNLLIAGCESNGTTTITAPAAVFEVDHAALYANLVAEIFDATDVLLLTTTVASRTDDTHIVLAASVPANSALKLRLVGGGFHGVIVDKIHLGFQQNTSYAPNSFDVRALQPIAAPASSTQGGVGGGGSGGGIYDNYDCIVGDTPIKQADGAWLAIKNNNPGLLWASGEFAPNLLLKIREGFDYVRLVRTKNGCQIECTDTERFVVSRTDTEGTPLFRLRKGDAVLTEIDDRIESSRIVEISEYLGKAAVYTPTLSNSHLFVAGEVKRPRFFLFRLPDFISRFFGLKRKTGGFVLHNRKYNDRQDMPVF